MTGRLDDFIRGLVLDSRVTPSKSPPPQARCLQIERIAEVSVAGRLGLCRGDLVVSIDRRPAGSFDPKLYRDPVERRPYTFWSPWRKERIDATITGVPIGAELSKTVAAIVKSFDPEIAVDLLFDLWQAGAWTDLERLSLQTLEDWGTRDSPALLLYGAALWEQGRGPEGMKCVREYGEKWISHWTTNFAAVAMYYEGQLLLTSGNEEEAADFFEDAFGFGEFVAGLHVVTMTAERREDRAYWFENEDEAVAEGLPLEVLLDEGGEVTAAVEPKGSPFIMALDRAGTVLVEGTMDQIDVWDALAKADPGRERQ